MAVSILAGTNGLVQLGLSISDLALLIDHGKKFGNFVRAGQNDEDLFDILNEDREAVLRRRGLVEIHEMETKFSHIGLILQGERVKGKTQSSKQNQAEMPEIDKKNKKKEKTDNVDGFTWVMVVIVSALDECLPSSDIRELLIKVFVAVLEREDDIERALRIHIKTNIESWRSFGCARGVGTEIKNNIRINLAKHSAGTHVVRSILQLNEAEKKDMENLLVWLLRGDSTTFSALSAVTFSIAEAWRAARLHLCTDGNPLYEGQACVTYRPDKLIFEHFSSETMPQPRGLGSKTLQISWPCGNPETMIYALGVGRPTEMAMAIAWEYGVKAANDLQLLGKADGPYEDKKEVYYSIEISPGAHCAKIFPPHIGMLANQGFPVTTEKIYEALEWMLEHEAPDSSVWLQTHAAQDYLLRAETAPEGQDPERMSVFCKYQALVFGFYYQLLGQILSFDRVEDNAFFHGIWGAQSTTLLAMCTQFSRCLNSSGRVSRAHVLYMLAAMYNGRRKIFNASSSIPRLVGVIGPISVLALPLMHTTDVPEEIWKIAVVDLPIVDLNADNGDGELLASEGGGMRFVPASENGQAAKATQAVVPTGKWTVHPCMSVVLGGERTSGIVMAARCGARLVGWFNPLAADIAFLSSTYLRKSYSEEEIVAFEVRDDDWTSGYVRRPDPVREGFQFGIVQSHNSPELRYAAAGFYGEAGEEIAIARSADEICGAFQRIQAQAQGMVIA